MSINLLIALLGLVLGSIYYFFEPLDVANGTTGKDMPLIELQGFTMYEFDTNSLLDILSGDKGFRYIDRYELFHFVYTDKEKEDIITLSAQNGLYKDDLLTLRKNVHYARSDGFEFRSEHAFYDKNKKYITSNTPYIASKWKNTIYGKYLYYDLQNEWAYSIGVDAYYIIKDKEDE